MHNINVLIITRSVMFRTFISVSAFLVAVLAAVRNYLNAPTKQVKTDRIFGALT